MDFDFKATPLNRRILDRQAILPQVIKKYQTGFDEFKLSKPNLKLGKRALEEYLEIQRRMENPEFKAREIDKRVF